MRKIFNSYRVEDSGEIFWDETAEVLFDTDDVVFAQRVVSPDGLAEAVWVTILGKEEGAVLVEGNLEDFLCDCDCDEIY